MKYILPLILIIITVSCKKKNKVQEQQLDNLLAEVSLFKDSLAAIDTAYIFETSREIKNNLSFLHKNVDTIDVNTAFIFATSYSGRDDIFFIEEHFLAFTKELSNSLQQLESLKIDQTNGVLPKDSFNIFFKEEKTIFINLKQKIRSSLAKSSYATKRINKQSCKIDSVITFIKKVN